MDPSRHHIADTFTLTLTLTLALQVSLDVRATASGVVAAVCVEVGAEEP